jgi:hypothetical protein
VTIISEQIESALNALPASILDRSGSAFYCGREAFAETRNLYLLGLNPGGNPVVQESNTVRKHIWQFRQRPNAWSEYRDESWEGAVPGTWGMQPRVLHMLETLGMDPGLTPSSNVLFVRSHSEAALHREKAALLRHCWPVHQTVIEQLGIRVIVCFGGTAGRWVCEQISASQLIDQFIERYKNRSWKSHAHQATDGRIVVTVTHPSRANWCNSDADPTPLIQRALKLA